MNFAKGILETRKQHYRHLKSLLVSDFRMRTDEKEAKFVDVHDQKTIPLETPTEIELGPQAQLRVTLFDVGTMSSQSVLAYL